MERTESLKQLVRDEAARLREFATVEERDRLDFSRLDPSREHLCIYGQMTGDCFNKRTQELLSYCAIRFSRWISYYHPVNNPKFYKSGARNGFSAIEFYIYQPYAKNAEIISYLKGETDILEL